MQDPEVVVVGAVAVAAEGTGHVHLHAGAVATAAADRHPGEAGATAAALAEALLPTAEVHHQLGLLADLLPGKTLTEMHTLMCYHGQAGFSPQNRFSMLLLSHLAYISTQ